VYWQQYITLPGFVHAYIDPNARVELILITDSAAVIALTILVNRMTSRIPAFRAIILGALISGLGWLVLAFHPAVWTCYAAIFVVAIGEIVHQPRYYEYISRLAPPGQQGTYMGFAFLPLGIGSLVGGWFGGKVMHYFGEVLHRPERAWWILSGVGLTTTLLLWIYDLTFKPGSGPAPGAASQETS